METKNYNQDYLLFYSHNGLHGQFSNFYPSPITINNKKYKTVQHFFQSQKFIEFPQYQREIINSKSGFQSAKLGRSRLYPLRKDWQVVKQQIMMQGLRHKFKIQNLKNKLLQTGNLILVQHTQKDNYWGDGGVLGKGKNRLGHLLMKLRQIIKSQTNKQ